MKFWLLLYLLTFGLFIGCKKGTPLVFSMESFTENSLELCKNIGCPDVTISYAVAQGDSEATKKINSEIKSYIISTLHIEDESESDAKTISEAVEGFIKTYRMDSADFPDMSAEYFAEINVSNSYSSKELVSFQLEQLLYTGGAHGYQNISFQSFNPNSGEVIFTEDLFNNIEAFTNLAENKFRESNSISENESINSTGFWFEDDLFYLPETIGITATDIILIYNQYEIASYADGSIELEIPVEEVSKYLSYK